ncbi:hypothetical protein D3C75_945760 [compost metagenome]
MTLLQKIIIPLDGDDMQINKPDPLHQIVNQISFGKAGPAALSGLADNNLGNAPLFGCFHNHVGNLSPLAFADQEFAAGSTAKPLPYHQVFFLVLVILIVPGSIHTQHSEGGSQQLCQSASPLN